MADLCQDFSNNNNREGEVIIDSAPSINNIKINLQKNVYNHHVQNQLVNKKLHINHD